jgi:hypothetical protein
MRSRSGRLARDRGGMFDVVMTSASRPTFPGSGWKLLGIGSFSTVPRAHCTDR